MLACAALVVSYLKVTRATDSTARHLYADLHSELRKLDSDVDDLYDRMKRLTARKGMRAKRDEEDAAASAGAMLPGETPDEWKRRMRRARQNGVQPQEV